MLRCRAVAMNDYSDMTRAELIARLQSNDAEGRIAPTQATLAR